MDNKLIREIDHESLFKDSVLSMAQGRGMEIVAQADQEQKKMLDETRQSLDKTDYASIKASLRREAAREKASYAQSARRSLLETRGELVETMFGEVEQKLAAFTKEPGYRDYLVSLAQKHADLLEDPALLITLRREDELYQPVLSQTFPGAQFAFSGRIRLGGLTVSNGKILYDETLDQALEQQKRAFYASGALSL